VAEPRGHSAGRGAAAPAWPAAGSGGRPREGAAGAGGAGGGGRRPARLPLPRALLPPLPSSWSAAPEGGGGRRREPREEPPPPPPPRHGARVSARGPVRPPDNMEAAPPRPPPPPPPPLLLLALCCSLAPAAGRWARAARGAAGRWGGRAAWTMAPEPRGQVRGRAPPPPKPLCKLGASWGARRGPPAVPAAAAAARGAARRPFVSHPARPWPGPPRPGPASGTRGRRPPRQVRRGRVLTCPPPGARSEKRRRACGRAGGLGRRGVRVPAPGQASPVESCSGISLASLFATAARAPRTDLSCSEKVLSPGGAARPALLPL
jgi:hypothetical protein